MKKDIRKIKAGGKELPCYQTMGTMLKYRNLTGEEVSAIGNEDVSKMITLCYCQTACACEAEGVEMPYDLEQFANRLNPQSFNAWCFSLGEGPEASETGEKKSPSR